MSILNIIFLNKLENSILPVSKCSYLEIRLLER